MSAVINVYNDGQVDLQVVKLNTRSNLPATQQILHVADRREESRPYQFRVGNDEVLIITTAESAG